ncbi:MAG: alpha-amylase [Gammaproteobacteria bacterium]|nr:alpha-amylase [Gammaproteobacteria bacterium]
MSSHAWWQRGVIYQIYPRSFQDSDADGIGDLPGILTRLDYLQWLGVTAVWISPIHPSPMADFGYDISDYEDIDPVFGTPGDFARLVTELHRRDLKLILDFVPNHTSDQHPWFRASRSSRSDPQRNWYIWREPAAGGGPPTNWRSEFGGPAWTLDEATGEYYYHAYLPQQPDLNWREPGVRQAMHQVMRFWLDRGVDGLRVDAIHMLVEDESLQDNPENPLWRPGMSPARQLLRVHTCDRPETHHMIAGMRRVLDEYDDRILIGEAYLPIDRLMLYYGESLAGFHLPFNFHLLSTAWNAAAIAALVRTYEAALPSGGWPNWVLGNHDRARLINRVGGIAQARLAAMLLLTLRGTPTLYYGDELGMSDAEVPANLVQDPWEKNVPGLGLGRDPCRSPMQWSSAPGADFTNGEPWLPLGADFKRVNVMAESADARSMLSLYRALLRLRQSEPALTVGAYREVRSDADVFIYEREYEERRMLIALNFGTQARSMHHPHGEGSIVLSTDPGRLPGGPCHVLDLAALEGVVAVLETRPAVARSSG